MQGFLDVMTMCFNILNIPMNIYGFTFSFWTVMLYTSLAGLIFSAIGGLLGDKDGGAVGETKHKGVTG